MVGGGGGDGDDGASSRKQATRGRQQKAASLPLDVMVDIATRTDPATFLRCAAMSVDMRCRVKEYISHRGPLRLRHGDRFVLPLLQGHLIYLSHYRRLRKPKDELCLMDTTAPDATKLRTAASGGFPLSSREGLVLARVRGAQELRVCNPATGMSLTLPSEPKFRSWYGKSYVLLVGDNTDKGATSVGRHFMVVVACLETSPQGSNLKLQTFSSEHGIWGLYREIWLPNLQCRCQPSLGKGLVTGGTVHWLCPTETGTYVLKLRVGVVDMVMVTKLPIGFPHNLDHPKLLATSSVGGDMISAWSQSKHTAEWKQQPHAVINVSEAILRFLDKTRGACVAPTKPVNFKLVCFAERSGTVLINTFKDYFWLDLQSMEIVRWLSDHRVPYGTQNIPYEMSLTAWVPTFSSTL